MIKYLEHSLFCCIAILLAGCTAEEESDNITGGKAVVNVILQMPAATTPTTYSISEIDENTVENIDVLAFEPTTEPGSGWAFAYHTEGTSITDQTTGNPTKSKKQFTAKLIKKSNQQLLVILANAHTQVQALGAIAAGTDKDVLLSQLICENTGNWNANNDNSKQERDSNRFSPFPMYGEIKTTVNDATVEITGVKLLRAIARMDVISNVTNFALKKIYLYNTNTKGCIVPATTNLDGADRVNAPTIPIGNVKNSSPLEYTVPTEMKYGFLRTMYLFEAKAADATCMVIGGTYGSDSALTYYRIDFFKKNSNGKNTDEHCDILRNYRYLINVITVSGRGYDTPEQAFNAKPANLKYDIEDLSTNTTDTDFNGQYYLSVNKNPVNLFGEETSDIYLLVKTNYPYGWTPSVPNSNDSWITIEGASYTSIYIGVSANTTASERQGTIRIKAGDLIKDITVIQSNTREMSLQVMQHGRALTKLSFQSQSPAAETLQVVWKPTDARCIVSVSHTKGGGLSLGTPANPTTSGQDHTLSPSGIADITTDPFIEKESVVTYTLIDDVTGKTLSQSVTLSQINYALVATEHTTPYLMDGKTKRFKIKSNLPWTVRATSNPGMITSFTATEGEANKSAHDFEFTIKNRLSANSIAKESFQLCFSSNSGDVNKTFNDVLVNMRGTTGLEFTYNNQTYIGDYIDNLTLHNWNEANNKCTAIGTGWRLPTKDELLTGSGSFIETLYATGYGSYGYWAGQSSSKYYVTFTSSGRNAISTSGDLRYTRCVYGPVQ